MGGASGRLTGAAFVTPPRSEGANPILAILSTAGQKPAVNAGVKLGQVAAQNRATLRLGVTGDRVPQRSLIALVKC